MNLQNIYDKLSKKCPPKYQINEIIPFNYPYREVEIKATVSKQPEKSLQQIYTVLLQTIEMGCSTEDEITGFLGLQKDDFILRELYFLREKNYIDLVSEKWLITEEGKKFIKDNSILSILEEEKFKFLIDGINGEVVEKFTYNKGEGEELKEEINISHKNSELLKNKHENISDVYKKSNNQEAYLIDYQEDNILFDKKCLHNYFLIEYIPIRQYKEEIDPYIEVRYSGDNCSLERRVTKILNDKYPNIILKLSSSDRKVIDDIKKEDDELADEFTSQENKESKNSNPKTLTIWETQDKFAESLKKVKSKILIESPWIKRATLKYIRDFENALKRKVNIWILYGIDEEDNHHPRTIEEIKKLEKKYSKFFHLIHLPTHFKKIENKKMTGTHRKLLIKDNNYYIAGSFNFLSFNKKEGQQVANEESILISSNVEKKWQEVFREYKLNI